MKYKKTGLLFLVTVLALLFGLKSVSAVNYGGLGIYPNRSEWNEKNPLTQSWFIYTLEPGETKQGKVDVVNTSEEAMTARIYPVDAVTTKDGAFAPRPENVERTGVGAWITLSESEIILKPNEPKTVDFTLRVPENAEVGDHMGAIIIQAKESPEATEGTAMRVVNRVGARVYLTVPGEIVKKLDFTEFTRKLLDGKNIFYLSFVNGGNIRIAPLGEIEIRNIFGRVVNKTEITQREVFPKNTITIPVEITEKIGIGKFNVSANVTYDEDKTLSKEIDFWVAPSQKSLITFSSIVVVIALLLAIISIIRKKRQKIEDEIKRKYIVKEGETIEDIAQKFNMNWRRLAKLNHLSPPYILKPSQKISVLDKDKQ